uniref:RRM domain-containing protein n=1 Tax=Salix viminalis TaxID=40686 RepID=A0A6N2L3M0_SALVM
MESDLGKLFIGGFHGTLMRNVLNNILANPTDAERVIMEKHVIDGRMDDQHILSRNFSNIHGSPGPGRTKKIFVGGLASTVTENEFKKYFEQYGIITDVVVMYDHNTQRPRGFGFITFDLEEAVDRVLHKTFHELNGKMVEVKRAVPKELSPGPRYNMSSVGGFGMRMDGRFNPLAIGRSGFAPFGTSEPVLSPSYDGGSNFGNTPAYGRISSPYYSSNPSRYNTPIGYGVGNARNNSLLSPPRNVWGNGVLNTGTNPGSPGPLLGSGSGRFGVSFGNSGANWGTSTVSAQGGGSMSGYTSGSTGYGSGFARNNGAGVPPPSSFSGSIGGYEGGSYGEFYRSGSVYGDSTWRTAIPELDGSGSFGYGPEDVASDVTTKSSEGCIGSYGVTSRQTNRGNTLL